jgi:hypothetical protein
MRGGRRRGERDEHGGSVNGEPDRDVSHEIVDEIGGA